MEAGEEGDYIYMQSSRTFGNFYANLLFFLDLYQLYISLDCHHQNDFCIQMGSDERHFNVSLIVRDKVARKCPQTTTFEQKAQPKRIRTGVPLLTSLTPYR